MMKAPEPGQFDAMDPDNISPLVVWLGSADSKDVTGRMFEIEGGSLSVCDGWQHGTPIVKDRRWEPAEVGARGAPVDCHGPGARTRLRRHDLTGAPMKFGLFYELQLPRPWEPDDEYDLYKNTLDQIELADSLGFDYIWAVEHHFLEEYSHCSAPEVLLAAASQRTKRIRLGHGIVQLPNEINPTARVAERLAALDLLSDGRVDFGSGEASSVAELLGFGVDWDSKRAQWADNLDAVTRMMVEEPFAGWDSTWLQVPPRNVVPKPRQKPHPPLWVACSQPSTIQLAASKGIGALSFAFLDPSQAKEIVDGYYETLTSGTVEPAGFAVNANVAIVLPLMCHDRRADRARPGDSRARSSSGTRSATTTCSAPSSPVSPTSGTASRTAPRPASATPARSSRARTSATRRRPRTRAKISCAARSVLPTACVRC